MTEFLIQKLSDRADVYHRAPGIWYSDELKRWMVTSPELIRQTMYDDAFGAPTYDISPVADRLGIDLHFLKELFSRFPIAADGERHAVLREKFARHIARHSAPALAALSAELDRCADRLAAIPAGEEFCVSANFLNPVLRSTVCALAGVNIPDDMPVDMIPQMGDDSISPNRRKKINALIGDIYRLMPESVPSEDRYMSCAIVALSSNTLPGTASLTFLECFRKAPRQFLPSVAWPTEPLRTSLPLIEKRVVRDTRLGPFELTKGSRLRLFIESEGVLPGDVFQYSELFFAVGAHRCVGMNISKQVWARLSQALSGIRRTLTVLSSTERPNDYVWNYPETIKARFDD